MKWAFIDKDGVEKEFSAEMQCISGFCGGVYYWNFYVRSKQIYPPNSWDIPHNLKNPAPSPQALFEEILKDSGVAIVIFGDIHKHRGDTAGGVAYELFKDIKGGTIPDDCEYIVEHTKPTMNWNSGNDCVVMVASRKDLASRYHDDDDGDCYSEDDDYGDGDPY